MDGEIITRAEMNEASSHADLLDNFINDASNSLSLQDLIDARDFLRTLAWKGQDR